MQMNKNTHYIQTTVNWVKLPSDIFIVDDASELLHKANKFGALLMNLDF